MGVLSSVGAAAQSPGTNQLTDMLNWGKNQFESWTGAKANEQNQANTEETWRREDTAHQREVADLVAAGLNPVLAAGGSGAPTSAAIPQRPTENAVASVLDSAKSVSTWADQVRMTRAQADKLAAEVEGQHQANIKAGHENDILGGTKEAVIAQAKAKAEVATSTVANEIAISGSKKLQEETKAIIEGHNAAIKNAEAGAEADGYHMSANGVWTYSEGMASIRRRLLEKGLAEKDLDLAAKKVYNTILGFDAEMKEIDTKWYKAEKWLGGAKSAASTAGSVVGAAKSGVQIPYYMPQ